MARYIDAEKIVYHEETICAGHGIYYTDRRVSEDEINKIATSDVVAVRCGDWMENDLSVFADCPPDGFPVAVCSVCGMKFCDIINNMGYMYNHCPHCGAKMN